MAYRGWNIHACQWLNFKKEWMLWYICLLVYIINNMSFHLVWIVRELKRFLFSISWLCSWIIFILFVFSFYHTRTNHNTVFEYIKRLVWSQWHNSVWRCILSSNNILVDKLNHRKIWNYFDWYHLHHFGMTNLIQVYRNWYTLSKIWIWMKLETL